MVLKSTTIKMLTGILKPTSGFCRINGKIPQDNRQDYVKDIERARSQRTQSHGGTGLKETYTVLKDLRCPRLALPQAHGRIKSWI